MGDVADMILDGTLCEDCGTYVGTPVGFVRLCEPCWRWRKDLRRQAEKINRMFAKIRQVRREEGW